jgi:chaperonin GroES
MNLIPYGDRILVEPLEDKSTTPGGIIIPDDSRQKSQYGKVLAVGNKCSIVEVDDIVFCGKYSGTMIDDKQCIFKEDDVLLFVKKEDQDLMG